MLIYAYRSKERGKSTETVPESSIVGLFYAEKTKRTNKSSQFLYNFQLCILHAKDRFGHVRSKLLYCVLS